MSLIPEVETAIDDIINQAIIQDPDEPIVSIILDKLKQPDNIKKMITEEFNEVLKLLEFQTHAYEVFKKWYVDARIFYHIIVDEKNLGEGIKELRYIDPRKIRKIREVSKQRSQVNANNVVAKTVAEYFIYNEQGFAPKVGQPIPINTSQQQGVRIAPDSIAYVTSGLTNANNDLVIGYLNKAIKPLNQLKSIEDSMVIYRLTRAPERRIFYIDVGGLPKAKAEQYIKDQMTKFKNKVIYNAADGTVRDGRNFQSMTEDFWMPRRGDGKTTEITTLQGGQSLLNMQDVEYFQQNLYRSLNIPIGRLQSESGFNLGRSSEITRDEVKFQKFIARLRLRFQNLFLIILGKQLILKGIITEEDWKEFSPNIDFRFAEDNFFAELKEIEILNERAALLQQVDAFAGKYYSHEWIRKNVLRQTDKDIEEIDKQIEEEADNPQYISSFQPQLQQQQAEEQQQMQMDQMAQEKEQSKPINN